MDCIDRCFPIRSNKTSHSFSFYSSNYYLFELLFVIDNVICREMLTRETALKADVFALGVTAIHLVSRKHIIIPVSILYCY